MTEQPDEAAMTRNGFLGGRVQLLQPKEGYRAGTDAVMLAAAIAAKAGQSVLELGVGTGAVLCCLNARVSGLTTTGLEIQPEYLAIARTNLASNGCAGELFEGGIQAPPKALKDRVFDHVFANPPFFPDYSATKAENSGKQIAHHATTSTQDWVSAALKRAKPSGMVTFIHRAERLAELLCALEGKAGSAKVLPIAARSDRAAGRVIIQARKGDKGALSILPPFILHQGEKHLRDGDDFSPEAEAILRRGAQLELRAKGYLVNEID